MATITPAHAYPVTSSGPFDTSPPYSGTFIPTIWSSKILANFYAASTFADVSNTDYEGDISKMGDKVIITRSPTITVGNYTVDSTLSYQVPTPDTVEMAIDRGKYFAFQLNDVLKYQAQPNLLDEFSASAAEQMRVAIDSMCWYGVFNQADAANKTAAAGKQSAAFNMGTEAAPVELTAAATGSGAVNVLEHVLAMAAVLDEQNVPETDRWLVLDPLTRQMLFQSDLGKVHVTGDGTSPIRNGLIGTIDRFKVYVTNNLPRKAAAANAPWVSGDGTQNSVTSTETGKQRVLLAGHKSALTFASQITNMETIRNPNDFGDFIRSLNVFGFKCVQPKALVTALVK